MSVRFQAKGYLIFRYPFEWAGDLPAGPSSEAELAALKAHLALWALSKKALNPGGDLMTGTVELTEWSGAEALELERTAASEMPFSEKEGLP